MSGLSQEKVCDFVLDFGFVGLAGVDFLWENYKNMNLGGMWLLESTMGASISEKFGSVGNVVV